MSGEKSKNVAVVGINEERAKVLIAEAIKGLLTVEGLADELKGLGFIVITEEQAKELARGMVADTLAAFKADLLKLDLVTRAELDEALHDLQPHSLEAITGTLLRAEEEAEPPTLDPAYLDGLTFHGSERKKGKEGERDVHVPTKRPLRPEDVLSFRETATHIHIATADGKKHQVKK